MKIEEIRKNTPDGATHSNGKKTFYMWSDEDGLFKWCRKTKSWYWVSYYYEDYIKPL